MNFLWSMWYKFQSWRFERKCIKHLGMKPQKVYVTEEQYDALIQAINAPPDSESVAKIRKVLERKAPWDDE